VIPNRWRAARAISLLGFMAAPNGLVFPMTAVLVAWVSSAFALDRAGAIDVAKRQVEGRCTTTTPCTFDANAHEGNWHVRVQFTKRNAPQEKPLPYSGGHAVFIINQTGKVIGRMEGK
jgi:hypothetical protein